MTLRIRVPRFSLLSGPTYPPIYVGAAPSSRYVGAVGWMTLYLGAL